MLKKIATILLILFAVVNVLVFLFSAGTVFTAIPVIGSVANIVTVGYLHIWLPACAALFVCSVIIAAVDRKKGLWLVAVSFLSLIAAVVFMSANAIRLFRYGVKPNIFPKEADVSRVKKEELTYTRSQYGDVAINVYTVDDGQEGKPVMIYIHGGGWIQGSNEDHEYYSKTFAQNGYVVFAPEYDLSSEERHLASSTELQLCEAFAWVSEHAGDYGGDVSRLYVTGGSAGGNLALNISYKINSGLYSVSADGTPLPAVSAVSVTFPVASPADFYRNDDTVFRKMAHRMAYGYTGCSPEEDRFLYDSLEPVKNITQDAPATHIMVGAGDALVPPAPTYALGEALDKAKIDHQTVVVPYANHIFDTVDGSMLSNAYLDLSLRWFEEH